MKHFGDVSNEMISEFEEQIGYSFPADYRDYLLGENGEFPAGGCILLSEEAGETGVNIMYGLQGKLCPDNEEFDVDSLNFSWVTEAKYLPCNMIEFGGDGCGVSFCMYLSGEQKGHVYAFEPGAMQDMFEDETLKLNLTAEGTYFLAESFTSFLKKLTYDPDDV